MRFSLAVLFVAAMLMACGQDPFKSQWPDSKPQPTDAPTSFAFSGYVQKAFTIHVDGVSFEDSEQFYTNFIADLVKPHYAVPANTDISVEGEYGMDEFGSDSWVFMTPTQKEGDLFQAQTDSASKFTVQITNQSANTSYKARLIIRIGLLISYPNKDPDHFCYVLTGAKDNVVMSDSAKPIIFDTFQTQMDTYKCEQVTNSQLVIPSLKKVEVKTKSGSTSDGSSK